MPFKYRCLLMISPLLLLLDQWTKSLVRTHIPPHGGISLIPNYIDLVHVMNTGAAFGMFAGAQGPWRTPFFFIIATTALVGIVLYCRSLPASERLLPLVLSLVVGGIIGNVIDRFRFGAVTDFLSVHWGAHVIDTTVAGWRIHFPLEWPAFNVADSAITVSMILLAYQLVKKR